MKHTELAVPPGGFHFLPVGTSSSHHPDRMTETSQIGPSPLRSVPLSSRQPSNPPSATPQPTPRNRSRRSRQTPSTSLASDEPPSSRPRAQAFAADLYKVDILARTQSIFDTYLLVKSGPDPNIHLKAKLAGEFNTNKKKMGTVLNRWEEFHLMVANFYETSGLPPRISRGRRHPQTNTDTPGQTAQ
jgi:hypothetical protein